MRVGVGVGVFVDVGVAVGTESPTPVEGNALFVPHMIRTTPGPPDELPARAPPPPYV